MDMNQTSYLSIASDSPTDIKSLRTMKILQNFSSPRSKFFKKSHVEFTLREDRYYGCCVTQPLVYNRQKKMNFCFVQALNCPEHSNTRLYFFRYSMLLLLSKFGLRRLFTWCL